VSKEEYEKAWEVPAFTTTIDEKSVIRLMSRQQYDKN